MSLLSVVKDACMAIGVNPPASMFASSIQPRTQAELLALANEMAQRIAYDIREWRELKLIAVMTGDGTADRFPLPENFKRMLLTAQVYPSWAPRQPLTFVADTDEWLMRRLNNETHSWGEWTLIGNDMLIHPVVALGARVTFAYLDKNCVQLRGPNNEFNGYSDQFMSDADVFRINERLLKLALIWQWKANKGSPYAEDMGTYSDALANVAGADSPAPIIVDQGRRGRVDASQLSY